MSSIKKQFFKELSDYLMQELQFTDDIPGVKYVDKNLGQFELMHDGINVIPLPAVLIGFPGADFEGMMSRDQTAEVTMLIRSGFENYLDANAGNPNRDMALQFFEFNERVHNAVNKFKMQRIGGITRVGENEDDDHANVIVTDIYYRFTMYSEEDSGVTYVTGKVKPNFQKDPPEGYTTDDYVIPGRQ